MCEGRKSHQKLDGRAELDDEEELLARRLGFQGVPFSGSHLLDDLVIPILFGVQIGDLAAKESGLEEYHRIQFRSSSCSHHTLDVLGDHRTAVTAHQNDRVPAKFPS